MNVSHERINLLEASEAFRVEFLSLVDEQQRAGDNWPNVEPARVNFTSHIRQLHDHSQGRDLPTGFVPTTTFWLVEDDRTISEGCRDVRRAVQPG